MCPGMRSVQASNFSLQTQMALDISGSIISVHRVLEKLQIGTLWTDMCWNGGESNSLLAQVLRNQVSLPWVSRWPESEPARQALDSRWDTYSSTSHRRPWEKNLKRWSIYQSQDPSISLASLSVNHYLMHTPICVYRSCLYFLRKFWRYFLKYDKISPMLSWKWVNNKKIVAFHLLKLNTVTNLMFLQGYSD